MSRPEGVVVLAILIAILILAVTAALQEGVIGL